MLIPVLSAARSMPLIKAGARLKQVPPFMGPAELALVLKTHFNSRGAMLKRAHGEEGLPLQQWLRLLLTWPPADIAHADLATLLMWPLLMWPSALAFKCCVQCQGRSAAPSSAPTPS